MPDPDPAPLHVLVAEDEALAAMALEDFLSRKGFRVTLAQDGQEGLERYSADPADLVLDAASREVTRDGEAVALTSTEFELLRLLMRNQRKALDRNEILRQVWNYDFGGRSSIVDLYVSYLRKKVDAGRAPMIHTVRGVGYMLRPAQ